MHNVTFLENQPKPFLKILSDYELVYTKQRLRDSKNQDVKNKTYFQSFVSWEEKT